VLLRLEKKKTISRLVRMFVFWERGVGAVVRLFVFWEREVGAVITVKIQRMH
jgi:hypothetical protein